MHRIKIKNDPGEVWVSKHGVSLRETCHKNEQNSNINHMFLLFYD